MSPADTDTTIRASTNPSVHTDVALPEGPTYRSMLTRYVDHVTFHILQGKVYMLFFITNYLSWLD